MMPKVDLIKSTPAADGQSAFHRGTRRENRCTSSQEPVAARVLNRLKQYLEQRLPGSGHHRDTAKTEGFADLKTRFGDKRPS